MRGGSGSVGSGNSNILRTCSSETPLARFFDTIRLTYAAISSSPLALSSSTPYIPLAADELREPVSLGLRREDVEAGLGTRLGIDILLVKLRVDLVEERVSFATVVAGTEARRIPACSVDFGRDFLVAEESPLPTEAEVERSEDC